MESFIRRQSSSSFTILVILIPLLYPTQCLIPTKNRQTFSSLTRLRLSNASCGTSSDHDHHRQHGHMTQHASIDQKDPPLLLSSSSSSNARVPTVTKAATSIAMSRRQVLLLSAASTLSVLPLVANAADGYDIDDAGDEKSFSLEDLEVGRGRWEAIDQSGGITDSSSEGSLSPTETSVIPASFATYLARFLINYDSGVSSWWNELNESCSLMSDTQRQEKLNKSFGSLAASIQLGLEKYVRRESESSESTSEQSLYTKLANILLTNYANGSQKDSTINGDVERQIGLLLAMLPAHQQPVDVLSNLPKQAQLGGSAEKVTSSQRDDININDDLSDLLPAQYRLVKDSSDGVASYSIYPRIASMETEVSGQPGQMVVETTFGPLSSDPLTREMPTYTPDIYALFGISGATGCALTHAIVIPLDVVKTKAQTDPEEYKNVIKGAQRIIQNEGVQGLLTGAQATLAGYFWYGLSVYPSYAFFKRYMTLSLLPPELAAVHANDIALIAGALAAVIASLGLTPLEAARIRVVADPERYRSLGLKGTLGVIANEDPNVGWKAVYAGLPSLLTRQVIFGSVKFLAFERACEAIYSVWPFLRDATWTALTVSLVAGGFSGALSSVVSQPADSVLTYVAQNSGEKGSLGVIEGCFLMVEEDGPGSLFRGLGSRCLWAGSIIAGQFLLYDVFRTAFGVSGQDLSQVFQIAIPDIS